MDLLTRPSGPVVGIGGFRVVFPSNMVIRRLIAGLAIGLASTALGQSAVEGRPHVARSSAEAHASALPDLSGGNVQVVLAALGESQLDFFDDLEKQPLVCHDDALHACLLLGAGINATTFEQRVAMASQLGWIAPNFDRPALEAVTVGEVAKMAVAIMDGRREGPSPTPEQALTRAARVSPIPSTLRPYQGITGAQLLSMLGGVHDAMGARQEMESASAVEPMQPVQPIAAPAAATAPVAPVAPAVVEPPPRAEAPTAVEPVRAEPVRAPGASVQVVDVTPGRPAVVEEQPVRTAPTQAEPMALDLPGQKPVSEPARPADAPAHEAVISLDDRIGPPSTAPGTGRSAPAGEAAAVATAPAATAPGATAPGATAPGAEEAAVKEAAEEQAVRTSQFVPGKPLRRPTRK
ncbi:MAG: hypothetical protein KF768_03125 [Phycisphaeraceae bacterium]|nr:hypothetical protein [Phycisphaeraceae bacterium]